MRFGRYLVEQGIISDAQLVRAIERHQQSAEFFGAIAVRMRLMTPAQVLDLLDHQQASAGGPRLGEVAVRLGYLQDSDVERILEAQIAQRKTLGQILVEDGALTEEEHRVHLAAFRGLAPA